MSEHADTPPMRRFGPFLRDAWRLARPYFSSEERWAARGLLAAVVALNLLIVGITVVLNYWNKEFFNALQAKDAALFARLLFTWAPTDSGVMPGFCGIAAVYILIAIYRTYLNQALQIRWRRWFTGRLIDSWLGGRAYYRLSLEAQAGTTVFAGTDNPDQRISEDVRTFVAAALALSLDLLSNVVTLFSFLFVLWSLSGPITVAGITIPGYLVFVALGYSAVGTWLTHLVGRPLAALNFRKERVEADFRFALVRVRENVEGVALSAGEAEETRGLGLRFDAVRSNWWAIMQRTKFLNALTVGYGQIASIFPIAVIAPRFFSGEIGLGGLTQAAGAFGQVQGALSWAVDAYSSVAQFRATVERLSGFERAIAVAQESGSGFSSLEGASPALVRGTLALPNGRVLSHADIALRSGENTVITGRSGSGKSTLFRALAGIWPFGSGHITRGAGTSLFLPQRPYIPLGTLRTALCYPGDPAGVPDADVRAALADAGLGHLADRLDMEENLSQRLSGGEQQRLAVARALIVRPDWLFLDEATASLDPQAETELYAVLRKKLPGTTLVSIAHRPSVAAFHDRRLVFGDGRVTEAEKTQA